MSQVLRVWDVRRLQPLSKGRKSPIEINFDEIEEKTKEDKALMRAEWRHGQSASSAYWDPHGRRIVSTSYDNSIKRTSGYTIRTRCLLILPSSVGH